MPYCVYGPHQQKLAHDGLSSGSLEYYELQLSRCSLTGAEHKLLLVRTHTILGILRLVVAHSLDSHKYKSHQLSQWWEDTNRMHDKYVDPTIPLIWFSDANATTGNQQTEQFATRTTDNNANRAHSVQQKKNPERWCPPLGEKQGLTTLRCLRHGSAIQKRLWWIEASCWRSKEESTTASQE